MTEDTRYPENNVLIHRTPNKMERRFRRITNSLRRAWSEIVHIKARLNEIENRLNIDSTNLVDHDIVDEYSPNYREEYWNNSQNGEVMNTKIYLSVFIAGILAGILLMLVFM